MDIVFIFLSFIDALSRFITLIVWNLLDQTLLCFPSVGSEVTSVCHHVLQEKLWKCVDDLLEKGPESSQDLEV